MNKRVIVCFSSEASKDAGSIVNDEDVFIVENLLSVPSVKKDLALVLHSNGGSILSAERIIDVCRNYCNGKILRKKIVGKLDFCIKNGS